MNDNYVVTYVDPDGNVSHRKTFEQFLVVVFAGIKFIFDRLISLIGIILTLPLMIIIAVAIKLDSKGHILFRQKRTGKLGKDFYICKFRTMLENNDVHDFSRSDQHTRVGKFLRKTSLDELPQLFSIFIGNMSFIGPRPWITDYYAATLYVENRVLNLCRGGA